MFLVGVVGVVWACEPSWEFPWLGLLRYGGRDDGEDEDEFLHHGRFVIFHGRTIVSAKDLTVISIDLRRLLIFRIEACPYG